MQDQWLARFNHALRQANRARLAALAATDDATRWKLHREADRHIQAIVRSGAE